VGTEREDAPLGPGRSENFGVLLARIGERVTLLARSCKHRFLLYTEGEERRVVEAILAYCGSLNSTLWLPVQDHNRVLVSWPSRSADEAPESLPRD
jgi:hypothetical protein